MNSDAESENAASAITITNGVLKSTRVGQQWPTAIERRKRDARLARFADRIAADVVQRNDCRATWTGPAFPTRAASHSMKAECPPRRCGCSTQALPDKRSRCRTGMGCHLGHSPVAIDYRHTESIVRVRNNNHQSGQLPLPTQHPHRPRKTVGKRSHAV